MSKKSVSKKTKRQLAESANKELFADLDKLIADNATQETKVETSEEIPTAKVAELAQDARSANELIRIAEEMYKTLKDHAKENPAFQELEDKKKLDYFRERLDYKEFMSEYPVVCRYMICMGQYSSKAYRRMLDKIRLVVHPPPEKREKGYMEDQWTRRNADYVRYLWETYQKGHYDTSEAAYVWEHAYKTLKGEFDDFRDKYKAIEASTKEEKEKFKASNAKDLLERLKTGQQQLNEDDSKKLYEILKDKVYKRRFVNTMDELVKRTPVEPSCTGQGQMPVTADAEPTDKDKPKIVMVEHLRDESRINEVPENMLLDEATAKKLPGFMNSLAIPEESSDTDD